MTTQDDALRLHALKNCAAAISVLSKLLAKGPTDRRYIDRLQNTAARLTELLSTSLDQTTAPLEAAELMRFVCDAAEANAREHSVELVIASVPESVGSLGRDVGEALLNLVNNAIEATPPGGRVRIGLTTDDGGAQFFVRDEGPGMSPELVKNAGRSRVRSSKEHGSGVGLFLARRVVEDQGGSLDVESSTDGTTIRVLLPAA
jgi:two-component system sensor histidine kinase BaeS